MVSPHPHCLPTHSTLHRQSDKIPAIVVAPDIVLAIIPAILVASDIVIAIIIAIVIATSIIIAIVVATIAILLTI